jgi:hypothetical protein
MLLYTSINVSILLLLVLITSYYEGSSTVVCTVPTEGLGSLNIIGLSRIGTVTVTVKQAAAHHLR